MERLMVLFEINQRKAYFNEALLFQQVLNPWIALKRILRHFCMQTFHFLFCAKKVTQEENRRRLCTGKRLYACLKRINGATSTNAVVHVYGCCKGNPCVTSVKQHHESSQFMRGMHITSFTGLLTSDKEVQFWHRGVCGEDNFSVHSSAL